MRTMILPWWRPACRAFRRLTILILAYFLDTQTAQRFDKEISRRRTKGMETDIAYICQASHL